MEQIKQSFTSNVKLKNHNVSFAHFMVSCYLTCQFLARDVIYTSRAYATMSVSVCLWRKCIGAL